MKKLFIAQLMVAAVVFAACGNGAGQKALQDSNDSLRNELSLKDAALSELVGTMNLIEEGFKKINEMQGRINLSSITNEVSNSKIVEENIENITSALAKNKAEIDKLKKELLDGKKATKELKELIFNLEQQLIDKGHELFALQKSLADKNIHIGRLDSIVTMLTRENTGQELQLIAQEEELNSVWYAIGTKSELKGENILSGGEIMRESDVNMKYFTKADKRELKTIETFAKRAKLLTNHPNGSYTLERNADKQYVLTITDADAFWTTTKYLVIQVR